MKLIKITHHHVRIFRVSGLKIKQGQSATAIGPTVHGA